MATITLNDQQLRLIMFSLELYSRVGILQFERMLDHPTIEAAIERQFTPNQKVMLGSKTCRGMVVKMTKKAIWTEGVWNGTPEIKKWTDIENVKLSPDYDQMSQTRDLIRAWLNEVKKLVAGDPIYNSSGASYGIHNPYADVTCREAYDMIQVIRHEFWKANPKRNDSTVDSHVMIWTKQPRIEVTLDATGVAK
jgi:hypothetical protein